MASKFKKGDKVVVISGRDKGREGEIMKMFPKLSRAVVNGVNVAKRHTRASASSQGGIVDKELPIHVSNLAHVDPKSGKPTRVGFRLLESGAKVRYAKASGEVIDN